MVARGQAGTGGWQPVCDTMCGLGASFCTARNCRARFPGALDNTSAQRHCATNPPPAVCVLRTESQRIPRSRVPRRPSHRRARPRAPPLRRPQDSVSGRVTNGGSGVPPVSDQPARGGAPAARYVEPGGGDGDRGPAAGPQVCHGLGARLHIQREESRRRRLRVVTPRNFHLCPGALRGQTDRQVRKKHRHSAPARAGARVVPSCHSLLSQFSSQKVCDVLPEEHRGPPIRRGHSGHCLCALRSRTNRSRLQPGCKRIIAVGADSEAFPSTGRRAAAKQKGRGGRPQEVRCRIERCYFRLFLYLKRSRGRLLCTWLLQQTETSRAIQPPAGEPGEGACFPP